MVKYKCWGGLKIRVMDCKTGQGTYYWSTGKVAIVTGVIVKVTSIPGLGLMMNIMDLEYLNGVAELWYAHTLPLMFTLSIGEIF
jgi:hypothetical protein